MFAWTCPPRQYYRLREEAISILSIRLWSVPEEEMGRVVGLVEVLDSMTTFLDWYNKRNKNHANRRIFLIIGKTLLFEWFSA